MNKKVVTEHSSPWERFSSYTYLRRKLKTVGFRALPAWIWSKIGVWPERKTRKFRAMYHRKKELKSSTNEKIGDVLYAFYDLEVSYVTFDICTFLAQAEIARIAEKCNKLHIVIVPARSEHGFKKDFNSYVNIEEDQWRVKNLLIPCCLLLTSCNNISLCNSRKEAAHISRNLAYKIFPATYTIHVPLAKTFWSELNTLHDSQNDVRVFSASNKVRAYVAQYLKNKAGNRKVVTITLRECSYSQDRNSNLDEWLKFANSLSREEYYVVFIRDIETSFDVTQKMKGFDVFSDVVWNIDLRVALYELSYVLLTVNNGPNILAILNKNVRYLLYKICTPTVKVTTEKFLKEYLELDRGQSFKMADEFQKIVWDDDDFEHIKPAFDKMDLLIEQKYGVDFRPHLKVKEHDLTI